MHLYLIRGHYHHFPSAKCASDRVYPVSLQKADLRAIYLKDLDLLYRNVETENFEHESRAQQ
jgi:hypothetical protein